MYEYNTVPDANIPEIRLVLEMLRVLIRCVAEAPEAVDTTAKVRAVLRNERILYGGGDLCSSFVDGDEPGDDRDSERFLAAEAVALKMFENIVYGGGCGEEGCCGPHGLWYGRRKPSADHGASMIAAIKNEVGASPLWATTSVQLRTEGKEDEIAEGLARSKLTTFTRILPVKQAELLTIYFEDADAAERFRAELVPSHKADGAPAQIYRLP